MTYDIYCIGFETENLLQRATTVSRAVDPATTVAKLLPPFELSRLSYSASSPLLLLLLLLLSPQSRQPKGICLH